MRYLFIPFMLLMLYTGARAQSNISNIITQQDTLSLHFSKYQIKYQGCPVAWTRLPKELPTNITVSISRANQSAPDLLLFWGNPDLHEKASQVQCHNQASSNYERMTINLQDNPYAQNGDSYEYYLLMVGRTDTGACINENMSVESIITILNPSRTLAEYQEKIFLGDTRPSGGVRIVTGGCEGCYTMDEIADDLELDPELFTGIIGLFTPQEVIYINNWLKNYSTHPQPFSLPNFKDFLRSNKMWNHPSIELAPRNNNSQPFNDDSTPFPDDYNFPPSHHDPTPSYDPFPPSYDISPPSIPYGGHDPSAPTNINNLQFQLATNGSEVNGQYGNTLNVATILPSEAISGESAMQAQSKVWLMAQNNAQQPATCAYQ